jgi:hypothetical protein
VPGILGVRVAADVVSTLGLCLPGTDHARSSIDLHGEGAACASGEQPAHIPTAIPAISRERKLVHGVGGERLPDVAVRRSAVAISAGDILDLPTLAAGAS